MAEKAAILRRMATEEGRETPAIQMRATLHLLPEGDTSTTRGSLIGTLEEVRSAISAYAAAGVDGFVLDTFYGSSLVENKDTGEVLTILQRFADALIPEFENNTASSLD